jgi:methylmalonyl-CoA mutase N-terminal domain/subunit
MTDDRTPLAAFPYRRSITDEPSSTKPWVVGQYSGFSDPASTNARFREIVSKGGSGLSVALDLPTQWGLDPDHDLADGEIGRVGVSLSSLDDFDALLDGIDLTVIREISTTANSIGPVWVALVLALARRRGFDPRDIRIRIQNDPLKEYVARGTHVLAPDAAAEFAVDAIEYCARNLPDWVPMTISGYHMRDAGATRVQELAFTLAHAREYLERALRRGLSAAEIARSVSWFLSASSEPFHEAAKFRAARELWATMLAEDFGVDDEEALKLRIIAYTLGGQMSPFEIQNNTVRITLGALGAMLGGVQTLFCSAIDEACGLPTDESALLSVRTQQILLQESGLAEFVDAAGDSSIVDTLTDELVKSARALAAEVAEQGGATAAIEAGWTRAQIDDSAWHEELRRRDLPRVGEGEGSSVGDIRIFELDPVVVERRREEFIAWRDARPAAEVDEALEVVRAAVAAGENPVESMAAAFEARATIGELMGVMMRERGVAHDRQLLVR